MSRCYACKDRPPRPRIGRRGPAPTLCQPCADLHHAQRYQRQRGQARARYAAKHPTAVLSRRVLPDPLASAHGAPCRCAYPAPRTDGPLLICGLCSREVPE